MDNKSEWPPRSFRCVSLDVLSERCKQDSKWGEQNHDPFTYLTILGEEYGEACQAALHDRFGGNEAGRLRDEMVQVAAVAFAIIECIDRDKWHWPE
jgi:NTP pyrophosphatase (non-canonical NTP hydrolase)